MRKLKIVTIVGTRPELIRLSRVIAKLDENCSHVLVHTGQNYDYELNEIFFADLGIREPDFFLGVGASTSAEVIGNVIIKVSDLLSKVQPDAVLSLGDTNSCLGLLAAKRQKIPTFHMEAGNRCFDMRVPEEINRKIVDHLADVNFTYSKIARDYLLAEGLPPDRIIKTGSPMFEVLNFHMNKINRSDILSHLGLKARNYFLVSAHREENVDPEERFTSLVEAVNSVAETYGLPVIVSTHPRTRKRIDDTKLDFHEKVKLLKPFNFTDYNKLQISARAVLSDSGTINEEAMILNFPALNLRDAHERPEAMEELGVMMVGLNIERIHQGLAVLNSRINSTGNKTRIVEDYNIPNLSDKIVSLIHGYTDYVNRVVWKRH